MKWRSKIPIYGDKRIVKRFLLFPMRLGRDARWLEIAYILQEWNVGWNNERWTDSDTYDTFVKGVFHNKREIS